MAQVAPQAYVKASNPEASDGFGTAMAISGTTLVVGAPGEDSAATGADGNQASNAISGSGAAYVLELVDGAWVQRAYLKASNTGANDAFGSAVAIDGDIIVVGAPTEDGSSPGVNGADNNAAVDAGAAYVFVRSGDNWTLTDTLKASNPGVGDQFGTSVAVSGETILVGAPGEDGNGSGVDPLDNNVGSERGAAYVFVRSAGVWSQQAYLKASASANDDEFGRAVAISGDRAVVGAPREDNGGINDAGAVFTYVRAGGVWSTVSATRASNPGAGDEFGAAVALLGDTLVVGAPREDSAANVINGSQADGAANAGAAYVFAWSGGDWAQTTYLKPSNNAVGNEFGGAVALALNTIVVGAQFEDTGLGNSGAGYRFVRNGASWSQSGFLKPASAGFEDRYGTAVAAGVGVFAIGGPREDGAASGVNGNEADNSALSAGAAYVFAPASADQTRPVVSAPRKVKTKKSRVTLRGTAGDNVALQAVQFKAPGKGWRSARLSGTSWRAVVRLKASQVRAAVRVRARDTAGNFSTVRRVVIQRRS